MNNDLTACEEKLARLSKDFENFVYIISHDFKAPVRAITNLSAWIEEDLGENLPDDVRNNIRLLRNRTERLERMISAVLQVSRVSHRDLDVGPVSLQELLQETSKPFKKGNVAISLPSQLPVITTYYKKLQQVFEQLFQNAINFSDKEKVLISVTAVENQEAIWFTVQDNGPGIAPQNTDKIFNIFYTGRSKDNDAALGAGLTLVKQIIDFAGGSIELKNMDTGCTFLIKWPVILTKNI